MTTAPPRPGLAPPDRHPARRTSPARRVPARVSARRVAVRVAMRRPRDFTLLWSGSAVSQLGAFSVTTATPLLALSLGGSPVFVGWLLAAGTIPGLLLHLPAGFFVDRADRWRIMWISQLIRVLNAVALAAGLCIIAEPTILLIVAAVIDGTSAVFYNIAEIAAVRHVVPAEKLERAMARNEARQHIALIFGRPLGGFLFDLHRTLPYGFGALSSLLSIAALATMRSRRLRPTPAPAPDSAPDSAPASTLTPEPAPAPRGRAHAPQRRRRSGRPAAREVGFGTALRLVGHDAFLRTTVGACAVGNIFFQTVILLLFVLARQQHLSTSLFGLLLATSGLGGLLGAMVAPRVLDRFSPRLVVIGCIWLWVPMIMTVAFSSRATVGLIAWGACSFMGVHLNVALASHQAKVVPGHLLGRVTSVNRFVTSGAVPIGALGSGYVLAWLDPRGTAILAAVAFAGIAVAASVFLASEWVVALVVVGPRIAARIGRNTLAALAGDPSGDPLTEFGRSPGIAAPAAIPHGEHDVRC